VRGKETWKARHFALELRLTTMSEKPISPLRQRMIEDMSVRNFVEKTRNDYIRHVKTFTAFLGRSPGRKDRFAMLSPVLLELLRAKIAQQ
jgi:hypothetical protein